MPAHDASTTLARQRLIGRLCIAAAAVLWSSSGLFVKSPWFADWPEAARGPLLAFWRGLFATLFLIPFVRRPRWRPVLVPLGISFATMSVLYMTSMTLTTAANAIWLQNIAPGWVFLLGVLLFRDPLDRRDFVPLSFALVGVAVILSHEIGGQAVVGVLCGLSSGLAYALVVLLLRRTAADDNAWIVALNQGVVVIALLPWVVWQGLWPTLGQLAVLVCFGIFQMALPYVLFARGLRTVSSQEAILIALIEPVLLPLWVWLAWGEVPRSWTTTGAAIILAGLLIRYGILERRK